MVRNSFVADRKHSSLLKAGVAALAIVAGSAMAVQAQQADATLNAQISSQKQLVAANPDNVRALFDLAMMQKQAGHRGDAISNLEKVRTMRSDLPRVDLELAMLHYAIGDYAEARPYFANARASSEASAKLREQIDLYVADIDRRLSPSSTHGNLVLGLSFQTNANGGTDELGDLANTIDPSQVSEQEDFNVFISGGVNHIQNINKGGRVTWDTSARGYGSVQFEVDQVNAFMAEVNTGFTFNMGKERMNAVTFRPYLKGNYLYLGEASYRSGYSGGLAGGVRPNEMLAFGLGYEFTKHNYHNSDERPNAEERNGEEHQVQGTAAVAFSKQDTLTLRGVGSFVTGDEKWWDYDQFEVGLRYSHRFSALVFPGELAGNISTGVSYTTAEYDMANPALVGTEARDEERWRVDANATIPFDKSIGMLVGLSYTDQESNVSLYDYDNLQATVGAAISF
ncbi:MAG: hypothetical protein ACPG06_02500 [Alphaproteobacteria bacterium]